MTNPMIMVMLLLFLVMSTRADEELIKTECNHTEYQNVCLFCLEADPISFNIDRAGLVNIIIHCLGSQLDVLINTVTSLKLMKGEGEANENVLKDCVTGFAIAQLRLQGANIDLITLNYDKAYELVKTALNYPRTCEENLQKLKFKDSSDVYDDILAYSQLTSVAKTLIHRL